MVIVINTVLSHKLSPRRRWESSGVGSLGQGCMDGWTYIYMPY